MKHEPLDQDVKWLMSFEPGRSRSLRRIPCSCGWAGAWYDVNSDGAERSFAFHAELAAEREAVSA